MRFVPNPKFHELAKRTPEMVATMLHRAENAAEACRSIAPVGDGTSDGHYRDSIEGQAGITNGGAVGRVNAKKFTAGWIEFGTSKMAPMAILRRGTESSGLSVGRAGRGGGPGMARGKKDWF